MVDKSGQFTADCHAHTMPNHTTQVQTVGAEKAAMEADPLFKEYMKKITDKGFFKGLEEGSKGACVTVVRWGGVDWRVCTWT